MRQADTDKNRHRPRVVLPKDECKKGGYYDNERASGRWLFFYCGNAGLNSSKNLRSPRARAAGFVRAAFFQDTTLLHFLSIENLYKIHNSGIPIFVRSDESKKVIARGLTNRFPHAIMYLQGKGNRYSHSTDQVLSLKKGDR